MSQPNGRHPSDPGFSIILSRKCIQRCASHGVALRPLPETASAEQRAAAFAFAQAIMADVASETVPEIARPVHLAELERQERALLQEGPSPADVAKVYDFFYSEDEGRGEAEMAAANEERAWANLEERIAPCHEALTRAIRGERYRRRPPRIVVTRRPARRAASPRRVRRVTATVTARGTPRLDDDPEPVSRFEESKQLRLELEPDLLDAPSRHDWVAELAIVRAFERQLARRLAIATTNRRRCEDRLLIEQAVRFVEAHPGCSGRRVRAVLGGSHSRVVAALHEAAQKGLLAVVRNRRGADAWFSTAIPPEGGPEPRPPALPPGEEQ